MKSPDNTKSSKSIYFWILLVIGIVTVSVASWFIGNSVAKLVIGSRGGDKTKTGLQAQNASDEEDVKDRLSKLEKADINNGENTSGDEESSDDESAASSDEEAGDETASPDQEQPAEQPAETPETSPDDTAESPDSGTTEQPPAEQPPAEPPAEVTKPAPAPQPAPAAPGAIYRVQLGSFKDRANAQKLADEATAKTGLPVTVIQDTSGAEPRFRVQAGAFSDKARADQTKAALQGQGYDVSIKESKTK